MVIEDEVHLTQTYRQIHANATSPPSLPKVNFETDLVLAAFMGQRPSTGYAISFATAVRIEGQVAQVRVIEKEPPPGAMLASVITSPYCLARLARGGFEAVQFVDAEDKLVKRVALTGGVPRGN